MDIFTISDRDGVALNLRLNEGAWPDPSYKEGYNVDITIPTEHEAPLLFFGADDLARIGVAFLKAASFLEHREAEKKLKERINMALTGKPT